MSNNDKKQGKYAARGRKKRSGGPLVWVLVILAVILVIEAAYLLISGREAPSTENPNLTQTNTPQTTAAPVETTPSGTEQNVVVVEPEPVSVNLGYGIYVTDIGSYTGAYVEDGTNEILSNILMLVVENRGEEDIQYAQINLELGEKQASFSLTTLPVGERMVLLEQNRMAYDDSIDYETVLPMLENVALFTEPMSLHEELKLQILDGAVNITNISGEDIAGNIVVYYKNAAVDIYYGGITYRVTVEGGLKAGETRQIMTSHASDSGSKIMFVTISQG